MARNNILKDLIPEAEQYEDIVRVIEIEGLQVVSDVMTTKSLMLLVEIVIILL